MEYQLSHRVIMHHATGIYRHLFADQNDPIRRHVVLVGFLSLSDILLSHTSNASIRNGTLTVPPILQEVEEDVRCRRI